MPELPDILVYVDALKQRVIGQSIEGVRVISPFVLRSFDPPIEDIVGKAVQDVRRMGKRIIFDLDGDLFVVIHLMIAGRFRWLKPSAKPPGKIALATLVFPNGTLALTEAAKKKRASLHIVRGSAQLVDFEMGGLDVLSSSVEDFAAALCRENHTLKRALTDPRLFDGIGNAYSDEILHAAGLSPLVQTKKLSEEQIERLHAQTQETLRNWIDRLHAEFADRFPGPGDITAFRPDFAVHGRYEKPCPVCNTAVQRIRYAENETNYCPTCQTGGRVLADRSLSRLLKDDWPRTVEELEEPR